MRFWPLPKRIIRRILYALAPVLFLASCELPAWLGEAEDDPLPGERISVLRLDSQLEPDPGIADLEVRLPPPWRNASWPQSGGVPSHAMHHLDAADILSIRWQIDIGEGSDDETRLTAMPVIAGGRIFTLDAVNRLAAYDIENGVELWRVNLTPRGEEDGAISGGIAYDDGTIYATTGYGMLFAVEAVTGELYWRVNIGVPLRSAPTVSAGRVFAVSHDNQSYAYSAFDGRKLWEHVGLPEDAGLVGGATPAVLGDVVISPYSSGEIVALKVQNGRVLWTDQLVRIRRFAPIAALNEIVGKPVIDGDRVLAISHSGRMAAIDLQSGRRLWDQNIAGVETPWVAGDFVYVLTSQAELVCLSRRDGRIRWISDLPAYEDPDDREDPIQWSGPVLAGDRLLVVSSDGYGVAVSPYSGEYLGEIELPGAAHLPPVVADGKVFVLTDDGQLTALF